MRDLTSTDASKALRFLWTVTDKFVRFCVAHRNSHFLPIWQSANLHIACRQRDYRFQSAYNCIHIVHLIAYALGDRQSSCRPCRHNSFNQSVSFIVSHECADSPSVSVSLVTFDLMRNWTRKKKKKKIDTVWLISMYRGCPHHQSSPTGFGLILRSISIIINISSGCVMNSRWPTNFTF